MIFGTKLAHNQYMLIVWSSIYLTIHNWTRPEPTARTWMRIHRSNAEGETREKGGSTTVGFRKVGISWITSWSEDIPEILFKGSWNAALNLKSGMMREMKKEGKRRMVEAGVSIIETPLPGWKGRLSTAGSPWPRSDRGEVFLIFVGFLVKKMQIQTWFKSTNLLPCRQSVCLLFHSVTAPGFGGLEAANGQITR